MFPPGESGESIVFDESEGEIDPFYEFFEKFVVAHPVGGVSVAVNDEIYARIYYLAPLLVRKVSFFGVDFDIRSVVRRRLGNFHGIAETEVADVGYHVDGIVFYGVDVAVGVELHEFCGRLSIENAVENITP